MPTSLSTPEEMFSALANGESYSKFNPSLGLQTNESNKE